MVVPRGYGTPCQKTPPAGLSPSKRIVSPMVFLTLTPSTVSNVARAGHVKLTLKREYYGLYSWLMAAFGSQSSTDPALWIMVEDKGLDGVANLNTIDFQGNQWYEVQMQIKTNGATGNLVNKGFSKLGINGVLDADSLASWGLTQWNGR